MTHRTFLLVTCVIFALIALLHALRLIYGWKASVGDWSIPLWVSWVGLIVAGYLAYQSFLLKRTQPS